MNLVDCVCGVTFSRATTTANLPQKKGPFGLGGRFGVSGQKGGKEDRGKTMFRNKLGRKESPLAHRKRKKDVPDVHVKSLFC